MPERASPWRSRPPQVVVERLQDLANTVLFLVHRTGPTCFVVREEGSEVKRRVSIGAHLSCSCCGPGPAAELCCHLLFVMTKVLKVPPGNPLVWQLSLTDRELEEVLQCSVIPADLAQAQGPAAAARKAEKVPAGQVQRRALDEEDPCPICYEDMHGLEEGMMVWCRTGCGRNVHGRCMGVWAEHQVRSLGKELTCPLCRADWGEFKWKPPAPRRKKAQSSEPSNVHQGTSCGCCKQAPLVGKRYRCLICADYDLCEGCFNQGQHAQHPFACRETPTSSATPAERPDLLAPLVLRLRAPPGSHTQGEQGGGTPGGRDISTRGPGPEGLQQVRQEGAESEMRSDQLSGQRSDLRSDDATEGPEAEMPPAPSHPPVQPQLHQQRSRRRSDYGPQRHAAGMPEGAAASEAVRAPAQEPLALQVTAVATLPSAATQRAIRRRQSATEGGEQQGGYICPPSRSLQPTLSQRQAHNRQRLGPRLRDHTRLMGGGAGASGGRHRGTLLDQQAYPHEDPPSKDLDLQSMLSATRLLLPGSQPHSPGPDLAQADAVTVLRRHLPAALAKQLCKGSAIKRAGVAGTATSLLPPLCPPTAVALQACTSPAVRAPRAASAQSMRHTRAAVTEEVAGELGLQGRQLGRWRSFNDAQPMQVEGHVSAIAVGNHMPESSRGHGAPLSPPVPRHGRRGERLASPSLVPSNNPAMAVARADGQPGPHVSLSGRHGDLRDSNQQDGSATSAAALPGRGASNTAVPPRHQASNALSPNVHHTGMHSIDFGDGLTSFEPTCELPPVHNSSGSTSQGLSGGNQRPVGSGHEWTVHENPVFGNLT